MAKTIQQIRSHIDKARIAESLTASEALERKRKVQAEMGEIMRNRELSEIGRTKAVAALKQKHGIEFLQDAYKLKQVYMEELRKAKEGADAIVYAKAKKPDAVKLERFEDELKALKTELMLTSRAETAKQKVEAFIQKHVKSADDRYFAFRVRDEFQQIASPILESAGTESAKYRAILGDMFERLDQISLSDDAREARQILDLADSMIERGSLFSGLVVESMTETLGREYASYLNKPEEFFADKPDLKPDDYVHPEDTPQAKAARAAEEQREKEQREFAERWRSMTRTIEQLRAGSQASE
ncbi:hypothetical protein KDJ56_14630 [Brevibacillus composti]|uniref:Uncharacterized protein n=1 Tax=Brevibacillus composti TaxID=2796470 RepID=A0A7T5JMM2_9BACL|nr:hypothetical protein [Brevibacillus composti]QQE73156.1 hypothetical protein JD108_14685 [Brevibacillus composti]QUO40234.1 hypothetical protein KDJ56_14630 [Brevibacillus composti]